MLRVAAETAAAAAAAAAIAEAAAAAAAATTAAAAAAITSLSVATYEFPDHDQPHQQPTAVQKKKKKSKPNKTMSYRCTEQISTPECFLPAGQIRLPVVPVPTTDAILS